LLINSNAAAMIVAVAMVAIISGSVSVNPVWLDCGFCRFIVIECVLCGYDICIFQVSASSSAVCWVSVLSMFTLSCEISSISVFAMYTLA